VSHTHSGVGTGCNTVVLTSPWTYLTEVCNQNRTETLNLQTNTYYRVEANAQTYSQPGGPTLEHRSEIRFTLPITP